MTLHPHQQDLTHPPGVPGSGAFLFLAEPSSPSHPSSHRKLRHRLQINHPSPNRPADVLGNILGWRQSTSRPLLHSASSSSSRSPSPRRSHSSTRPKLPPNHPALQQLPRIFRPANPTSPLTSPPHQPSNLRASSPNLSSTPPPQPTSSSFIPPLDPSDLSISSSLLTPSISLTASSSSFLSLNPPSPFSLPLGHILSSLEGSVQNNPHPHHQPSPSPSQSPPPTLKKSRSSEHLGLRHGLPAHKPISALSPLPSLKLRPTSTHSNPSTHLSRFRAALDSSISPPNLPASQASWSSRHYLNVPYRQDSRHKQHRFSLPAMHAILDASTSLYQMVGLESPTNSNPPTPNHPSMHGVASNESIRTAKPGMESKLSITPLSQLLPPAGDPSSHNPATPQSSHHSPTARRFQYPGVFDLFTHNPYPEPTQNFRQFLSPDLHPMLSSPSETSSTPSQARSLGLSINSSVDSSHQTSAFSHPHLPLSMDPRFVIWADLPASPHQPQATTTHHAKERSSVVLESRRHPRHPASASTSNLGIDHSTGHLTRLVPHHPSSVSISPTNSTHPKRWSRTGKIPANHPSDPLSNSSPNISAKPPSLHGSNHPGRSREDISHGHSPIPSSDDDPLPKPSCHNRILMAATIERWIAELTTQIDSLGLTEFFFTYRTIMKPTELAQLLASRFEWSIMFSSSVYAQSLPEWNLGSSILDPNSEKCILSLDGRCLVLDHEDETLRRVAKVRTFVMIRHWLVHHFEDDFLHDPKLQTELQDWLENLCWKIKRVQRMINWLDPNPSSTSQNSKQDLRQASFSGEDDLRILKTLRRTLRKQQLTHQQSFNLLVPGQFDSAMQSMSTLQDSQPGRPKYRQQKVDARELFKQTGAASDPESPLRRPRRSHTTDLINRFPSKLSPGHGRHHSVNTLAQVRAANFSNSDLRLCELEKTVLGENINHNDLDNEKHDSFKADTKLILKLKSIFESDTRVSRNRHAESIMKETSPNPLPYSHNQDSSRLLKHGRNSSTIPRHRASESASVPPKLLTTPQHRLNVSNPPPAQHQHGPLGFPQHHNPLQRYFTSTMGTIGRFKRMINNRSGPHMSSIPVANHHHNFSGGPASSSLFLSNDIDCHQDPFNNEIGDLLCVKGGLERYLSFFDIQRDSPLTAYEEEAKQEAEAAEIAHDHDHNNTLKNSEKSRLRRRSLGRDGVEELNPSSGSPIVQYDEGSQLSLSSSLSNTTCATPSIPSDTDGELEAKVSGDGQVVFAANFFGEPDQIADPVPTTTQEHLLHGSMSVETIKSECHPSNNPNSGMGLLKNQLRKKFTNKDMCPVLMRASTDESFSGSMPDHTSPITMHSEDSPRTSHLSLSLPSPNRSLSSELRPSSVQLDDVDAFDSDEEFPIGAQKLRRFPGTADLKQALTIGRKSLFNLKSGFLKANDDRLKRFSSDTSSSVGTRRVPSIAASMFRRSKLSHRSSTPVARSSAVSSIQQSHVPEVDEDTNGAPAVVANFVADGLESDDDEPGDVEAALRRLEGVIDADREKEKAKKVELQMMKSMQASRRPTRPSSQASYSGSRHSYNSQADELGDSLQTCSESAEDYSEHSDQADDDESQEEPEEGTEEEGQSCEGHDDYERHEETEVQNAAEAELTTGLSAEKLQPSSHVMAKQDQNELGTKLSSLTVGDTRHSGTASSDSVRAGRFSSRPKISTPTLPTPPSKLPHISGSKSHMRFFTASNTKKMSLDQANDRKIFQTNKKSQGAADRNAVTRGVPHKDSIHELLSVNNEAPTQHLSSNHSRHANLNGQPNSQGPTPVYPMIRKQTNPSSLPPLPPLHRSFLLDCRTEILAQQFCLIERDLLRNITWQELLLSKWQENRNGHGSSHHYHHGKQKGASRAGAVQDGVVTCWENFMKQRAKEKMKLKGRIQNHHLHHSSSLESENLRSSSRYKVGGTEIHALIMRFNLTCNWVASELVLTFNLEERVALLGKFIRLAFKCYRQNNFQTLTQIIHGLQTPYIERLKKTWSKLGIWESRMFRDLKEFTSHLSNFKSLRNVQDSLINGSSSNLSQASIMNGPGFNPRSSHSHSRGSSSSATACIPFLGLYLRDLTINDELPTYLDPTDPSVPVEIEETTGRLKTLSNPKLIESLPKLPMISEAQGRRFEGNSFLSSSSPSSAARRGSEGAESEVGLDDRHHDQGIDSGYYPLVNINKLRNYAKIVLKIIEFQNRSVRSFDFETDSKWFITCLKINCLEDDQLKSLSLTCEP